MTNLELSQLLRQIAAAYQILDENRFKIIAYERAADSIEHLTSEAKDLWDDGKLDEVPGLGKSLQTHLDELFRTGRVIYFESVLKQVPEAVFPLLLVPGLGPKKAYKLVIHLNLKSAKTALSDLEKAALSHRIAPLESFGEKSESDILDGIRSYKKGAIKENRMVLPDADAIASEISAFVQDGHNLERMDTLGSLRRQVSTIGDIDIAVATYKPQEVIKRFLAFKHQKIIETGPTGASLLLHNGRQVDLRVQDPKSYGAMLQYFTGSKNHNIKLRSIALTRGLSLNEYGIKNLKTGKTAAFATEEGFYKTLGMDWIAPELREDKGEIEAATVGKLPQLVKVGDIRGDLHLHTDYNLEPSHDLGADPLTEYLDSAGTLKYEYIGLSDHNPSVMNHTHKQIVDIMKRRKDYYEQQYYSGSNKSVRILIMCEVDILADGSVALPEKAFEFVDAVIVSVHSSFDQSKKVMTKRVLRALTFHPKVRIFGHPTGRLLGKREGIELDWSEIFSACQKSDIALEINAHPVRLDLPDHLAYQAVRGKLKLCINSDAHAADQMGMMRYGVSVARRGWAGQGDIVNTLEYNSFKQWLMRS